MRSRYLKPDELPKGKVKAPTRETRALPKRGYVKVYLVTSAQNNTEVHADLWRNILALAEYEDAEILVSSSTYAVNSRASKGQKRDAKKTAKEPVDAVEYWAPEVEPYRCDRSIQLAPALVFCGEVNILPTAVNPISGWESYTGRDSSIIPHAKFAMQPIPSPKSGGTKLIYTTGTVTLRHYIEKSAGQKASFHHGYGCLIVEVLHDGTWFVRQINADSEGAFYDLDRRVENGKITVGHRPEALIHGDVHVRQLEAGMCDLTWGAGGMVDTLRPRRQVFHDLLDFRAGNHHDRDDPWKTFDKVATGSADVLAEIAEGAKFLTSAIRPWCENIIVRSNHDEALLRWLKEVDWREDPRNAIFHLEANAKRLTESAAGNPKFDVIAWAFGHPWPMRYRVKWLQRDESYIVCPDAAGGIELGMHGDLGANGAKGSLAGFARTGQKCVVGDDHQGGIREGAYRVGVKGSLDQGYNRGMTSWTQTDCIVYANGKRSLITWWNGRWRG